MKYRTTYRMAAILSLGIAALLHLFSLIFFFFGNDAFVHENKVERQMPEQSLLQIFTSFLTVFIFCFVIFALNFKILQSNIRRWKTFIIIVSTIACTIAVTYILVTLQIWIHDYDLGHIYPWYLAGNMFRDFFLSLIIVFTAQIMHLSYKQQQTALENETLQAENIKSRYETLKSQVDPHFLFNTLNTLNTMIKIDPDKAQEYVQKMSSVFRYTLQNKEEISLKEELNFTQDYCLLMQIRYGESLKFEINVDKEYNGYHIIPLSIQVLVENAIKHNVITNRQPLTISIATGSDETLTVSNPLQVKKEAEPGEGIGLANLTERYHLRFNREVAVMRNETLFRVTLPLIKPENP